MILSDGKNNSGHTGSGKDLWRSCRDAPENRRYRSGAAWLDDLLFAGMDALLSEAFTLFTENMSRQYQDFFAQVTDAEGACQAITEMIYGSQVTTPDNMALMYQLYAYASDKPALKIVMQNWMQRSQNTLAQWFDAQTARALDAFIEGMTLHFVTDRTPLAREAILQMVKRIAGESMSCHSASGNKNPPTLNRNGGVDGLHKMGTSKKSSGNRYD